MYIIFMIDNGSSQSTYATTKDKVMEVVKRWYSENYSESNDEGFIAVEEAKKEGETAERLIQVNLDEEPEEVESYLSKKYMHLD